MPTKPQPRSQCRCFACLTAAQGVRPAPQESGNTRNPASGSCLSLFSAAGRNARQGLGGQHYCCTHAAALALGSLAARRKLRQSAHHNSQQPCASSWTTAHRRLCTDACFWQFPADSSCQVHCWLRCPARGAGSISLAAAMPGTRFRSSCAQGCSRLSCRTWCLFEPAYM